MQEVVAMKQKKKQAVPTWLKLQINGETLEVLRVWQLNDTAHKWPETAILRAKTTGAKQQVENDTVLLKFLNGNDIFSKDVNAILPRVLVPPGPLPCNPPHWNFVLVHGRASNTAVIEVPCFE
jgi:hypothetical protein